jgi:hypothetical protein
MKNTTKSLIAGVVMLGSLGVSTAEAFASGTPHNGIYLTNPDPSWKPAPIPPKSEWGRISGRIVPVNTSPGLKNLGANTGGYGLDIRGLMQWQPIVFAYGPFDKARNAWYWGWYPTWTPPTAEPVSSSGYFSVAVPPGRYSLYFSEEGDYVSNYYNGQSNGAGSGWGRDLSNPSGFVPPPTPYMFVVKPHQTTRLVTTRILSTQIYDYHANISGARSQLDLFGSGFDPTSTVTTDAPGITFTKSIFTSYLGSWVDQRVRTTLVMGPGTHVGTYLLNVKSILGTTSTTMTIFKAPGSKVFSARFGVPFNYAQK